MVWIRERKKEKFTQKLKEKEGKEKGKKMGPAPLSLEEEVNLDLLRFGRIFGRPRLSKMALNCLLFIEFG